MGGWTGLISHKSIHCQPAELEFKLNSQAAHQEVASDGSPFRFCICTDGIHGGGGEGGGGEGKDLNVSVPDVGTTRALVPV